MGRQSKTFTAKEIARVRKLHASGHSNASIAAALGLTRTQLDRYIRCRKFGNLPSRQGKKSPTHKVRTDDEEKSILFGQHRSEWEAKRNAIREAWTEDEGIRRARCILPHSERPPGLRWVKDD